MERPASGAIPIVRTTHLRRRVAFYVEALGFGVLRRERDHPAGGVAGHGTG